MTKLQVNQNTNFLSYWVFIFVLLLLSLVNIKNYTTSKKVLAAESQEVVNERFWSDFLTRNPSYIPGWIELQRTDKAVAIDPNYKTPIQ